MISSSLLNNNNIDNNNNEIQINKITNNIILYINKSINPIIIKYEIENNLPFILKIQLIFIDSKNILLKKNKKKKKKNSNNNNNNNNNNNKEEDNEEDDIIIDKQNELILEEIIEPYNRKYLGELSIKDSNYRSIIKINYNWKTKSYINQKLLEYIQRDDNIRQIEIDRTKQLIPQHRRNKPESAIELFSQYGIRYIDDDYFPKLSIYVRGELGGGGNIGREYEKRKAGLEYYNDDQINDELLKKYPITWRRASDIFGTAFSIFSNSEEISPSIIRIGPLSNLLFLETIYSLVEYPSIIQNLFHSNTLILNQCGMYQLCLYLNGTWQYITLDEYLPCFPTENSNGGLVCSKTNYLQTIWLPLLEKGFNKYCQSYKLESTFITQEDILIMCTGAPVIKFGNDKKVLKDNSLYSTNSLQINLWNQLLNYLENKYLVICQTIDFIKIVKNQKNGTETFISSYQGLKLEKTSYTLLRMIETSVGYIMEFRNPFNNPNFEWTGDWSESSSKWNSQIEFENGIDLQKNTNSFYISYQDFLQYFIGGNVCLIRSNEINGQLWFEQRARCWFQLSNITNKLYPNLSKMYVLKVSNKPTEIHFTLHQPYYSTKNPIDISITILRLTPEYKFELVCTSGLQTKNQVSTTSILTPDVYLIVPITTGCLMLEYQNKLKNKELSLSERNQIVLFNKSEKKFIKQVEDIFDEIFDRLDSDIDEILCHEELETFLKIKEGSNLSMNDSVYQWLISNFDSFDGGLTRLGYKQAQLYMYKCSGEDENIILNDIIGMGYNKSLKLQSAITTYLTIHSDSEDILFRSQHVDKSGYFEAIELMIKYRSTNIVEYEEESLRVYECQLSNGFSLGIENYSEIEKEIEINFTNVTEHMNLYSYRESLDTVDIIPAYKFSIIQHVFLLRNDNSEQNFKDIDMKWNYEIKIIK